jgi:uncharacterized protein YndB with AHSA1/START domain
VTDRPGELAIDGDDRHGSLPTDVNGRYGELAIDGELAVITFVRHLPYPVEAVWAAIADPEQRACWFGETAIEGRAGGLIEMMPLETPVPPEQKRMTGRILVWDPPHVLEHEWRQRVTEDSVVRYELVPDGDGTLLTRQSPDSVET